MPFTDRVSRSLIAVVATVLVAFLAAPRVGTERAQAITDPRTVQADAAAPLIEGGPPGRVALNGPWTLRSDASSRGRLKGWQAGAFAGSSVTVPNSANAKRITGEAGKRSFKGTIGWYSTSFNVEADGVYAIRFESVNHKADVYVDGRLVGSHTGLYLPFEYVVDLKAGVPHSLVVRADWRNPLRMKREAVDDRPD